MINSAKTAGITRISQVNGILLNTICEANLQEGRTAMTDQTIETLARKTLYILVAEQKLRAGEGMAPDLLAKDKALGDLLQTVHLTLNFVLIAVLLGHVGAALKHHFIDKDDVLTRMLRRRAD